MTWQKPLLVGVACFAASACDRNDPVHGKATSAAPPVEAPAPDKLAPRSIMRPAVVPPAPAPTPPPPMLVTIPFDAPGRALDDTQKAALDDVARRLTETGDKAIVRGSTDSHGSDRRNRLVSRRRALLVAAYLAQKGIARDRLTIVALGEERPIAPNAMPDGSDDPQGRARNRRVEIEMIANDVAPVVADKKDGTATQ